MINHPDTHIEDFLLEASHRILAAALIIERARDRDDHVDAWDYEIGREQLESVAAALKQAAKAIAVAEAPVPMLAPRGGAVMARPLTIAAEQDRIAAENTRRTAQKADERHAAELAWIATENTRRAALTAAERQAAIDKPIYWTAPRSGGGVMAAKYSASHRPASGAAKGGQGTAAGDESSRRLGSPPAKGQGGLRGRAGELLDRRGRRRHSWWQPRP